MRFQICLLLLVSACAGSAPPQEPATTVTVRSAMTPKEAVDVTRDTEIRQTDLAASREQVWNALHETHKALGIPFAEGDLASGTATFRLDNQIRTVAGKAASRYLDCGLGPAGPRADSYRLSIRLQHTLENRTSGTTTLSTALQAHARNPGISSDPVPCNSKGVLEREIGGMVATRVQPAN